SRPHSYPGPRQSQALLAGYQTVAAMKASPPAETALAGSLLAPIPPPQEVCAQNQQQRKQPQQQCGAVGGDVLPLVQRPINEQRGCLRAALHAPADDQHSAKLAQRPGKRQGHAIDETPP